MGGAAVLALLLLALGLFLLLDDGLLVELFVLEDVLVAHEVLLAVLLAVELALFDPASEAAVVDEVAAGEFPEEGLLLVVAGDAL